MRFVAAFVVVLASTLLLGAQRPSESNPPSDVYSALYLESDDLRHEAALQKLRTRVRIGFAREKLTMAVATLARESKCELNLPRETFEIKGLDPATTVTLREGEYEAGEALAAILKPLRLGVDFETERGSLFIWGVEEIRKQSYTRIYPVADLTLVDAGDVVCDVSMLLGIELMRSTPDAGWEHLGGDEMLGVFHAGFALIGRCSRETHNALQKRLASIRQDRREFARRARRLVDLYRQSANDPRPARSKAVSTPRESATEAFRKARRAMSILHKLQRTRN